MVIFYIVFLLILFSHFLFKECNHEEKEEFKVFAYFIGIIFISFFSWSIFNPLIVIEYIDNEMLDYIKPFKKDSITFIEAISFIIFIFSGLVIWITYFSILILIYFLSYSLSSKIFLFLKKNIYDVIYNKIKKE